MVNKKAAVATELANKDCCDNSAPRYIALEYGGVYDPDDSDWMIKCYRCGFGTKLLGSREDAVAAWNRQERSADQHS